MNSVTISLAKARPDKNILRFLQSGCSRAVNISIPHRNFTGPEQNPDFGVHKILKFTKFSPITRFMRVAVIGDYIRKASKRRFSEAKEPCVIFLRS